MVRKVLGVYRADKLLELITAEVVIQQKRSQKILQNIYTKNLRKENIFIYSEALDQNNIYKEFIQDFFVEKVSPALMTILLDRGVSNSAFERFSCVSSS